MRSVHLIVSDLFLPKDFSTEACADLRVPALNKLLARGASTRYNGSVTPEKLLGGLFGASSLGCAPIAAVSAAYDGLPQGNWLRADPVNLGLRRDKMVLSAVSPSIEEARGLCASLNEYFAGRGAEFFVPHPQRWYLRLDESPGIQTTPLPELFGCNIRGVLPTGEHAAHWHRVFNEVQMLLHTHPANEAREARGELPVNSVWFWGEGEWVQPPLQHYQSVSSDDELIKMFSAAANIPFFSWSEEWQASDGNQLVVWNGLRSAMQQGNLAVWRDALQTIENGYARPLWQALQGGKIAQIKIEVLAGHNSHNFVVTRRSAWSFWRRSKPLDQYSIV